VRLEIKDTDSYGRKTAIVWKGKTNINLQLVKEGLAWHYAYYAPDAKDLAAAEKTARKARKGLWKDKNPVNPYDFRKQSR
jgi:endonuclease YncB( thermonuclease family)